MKLIKYPMYHLGYLLSKDYVRTYSSMLTDVPPFLRILSVDEMNEYDILLLGGSDAGILLTEINRTDFDVVMKQAIENGLFYLGVSAGSMVAAGNLPFNLGYIKNPIEVHSEKGTTCGSLPHDGTIYLTDSQPFGLKGKQHRLLNKPYIVVNHTNKNDSECLNINALSFLHTVN